MALDPDILKQIRNNDPDLNLLDLHYQNINDNEAIILADALKDNRTLITVGIWGNSIGDKGTTALADVLKNNRTAIVLDLSYNQIGDEGAIALAHALKNNYTLDELDLSNNVIQTAGAIALANMLKNTLPLASFSLEGNRIEDEGEQAIVGALITSKNIIFARPSSDKLQAHCDENEAFVKKLINKIENDPGDLTQDDRKEIQERMPAILYVCEARFRREKEDVLEKLAKIGIKPIFGGTTQKLNAVREEQRRRALEDPTQGI